MHLIGLTGLRRSGKSTVSEFLCREFGFVELSFGDPLKRAVQEIFGLRREQLWGDEKEVVDPYWGVSPRALMQVIGTDLVRDALPRHLPPSFRGNVWRSVAEMRLNAARMNGAQAVVFSDVRFPDEVEFIRNQGGQIWHVERPSLEADDASAHSSEALGHSPHSARANFVLQNDREIQHLYEQIENHLRSRE